MPKRPYNVKNERCEIFFKLVLFELEKNRESQKYESVNMCQFNRRVGNVTDKAEPNLLLNFSEANLSVQCKRYHSETTGNLILDVYINTVQCNIESK